MVTHFDHIFAFSSEKTRSDAEMTSAFFQFNSFHEIPLNKRMVIDDFLCFYPRNKQTKNTARNTSATPLRALRSKATTRVTFQWLSPWHRSLPSAIR
jgi:hypothetical protein